MVVPELSLLPLLTAVARDNICLANPRIPDYNNLHHIIVCLSIKNPSLYMLGQSTIFIAAFYYYFSLHFRLKLNDSTNTKL